MEENKIDDCGYIVLSKPLRTVVGEMYLVKSKESGAEYVLAVSGEDNPDPRTDIGTYLPRSIDFAFRLNHPNVAHGIKFLTPRICKDIGNRMGFFLPTFKLTLAHAITSKLLKPMEKIKICFQMASALLYLERMGVMCPPTELHMIALDEDMNVKLMPFEEFILDSSQEYDHAFVRRMIVGDPAVEDVKIQSMPHWLGFFMLYTLLDPDNYPDTTIIGSDDHPQLFVFGTGFTRRISFFPKLEKALSEVEYEGSSAYRELQPKALASLIEKMLDLEHYPRKAEVFREGIVYGFVNRITVEKTVTELSRMYGFTVEEGNELIPKSTKTFIDEIIIEMLVKFLLGISNTDGISFEVAMLTADLFYRSIPYYEKLKGDEGYDTRNFGMLFIVCYRLAMKIYGKRINNMIRLYNIPALPATAEYAVKLNNVESSVIEIHKGVLHRRFLYHQCKSLGQCIDAYKELINPAYLNIDPFEWVQNHPPRHYSVIGWSLLLKDIIHELNLERDREIRKEQ